MVSVMEHGDNLEFSKKAYDDLPGNADFLTMITSNTSNIDYVKTRKEIADRILFKK